MKTPKDYLTWLDDRIAHALNQANSAKDVMEVAEANFHEAQTTHSDLLDIRANYRATHKSLHTIKKKKKASK